MEWQDIKSPRTLAKRLWSDDGLELKPDEFLKMYRRVRSQTNELNVLWRLGGATNDYLRRHPHTFAAPKGLARRLLSSEHLDARIIGLKLLSRCNVSDSEFLAAVIRALNRRSDHETCGGLFELGNWLDKSFREKRRPSSSRLRALGNSLQSLATSSRADYVVETATRQIGYLRELCA